MKAFILPVSLSRALTSVTNALLLASSGIASATYTCCVNRGGWSFLSAISILNTCWPTK